MSKTETNKEKKTRVFFGREAWVEHVREYQKSVLTQPEYAMRHNLNTATFRNWITKLKREERATRLPATAFVQIEVNPTSLKVDRPVPGAKSQELHIRLPNGIECTFPSNHTSALILLWIDYLRVLP